MRSPLRLVLMAVLLPVALIIITHFIPVISVNSFGAAFAVFVVVGVLNALVRPLLIRLTLPITVMTFGLFSLIINTVILWLASLVVLGLHVSSFLDALIVSVILTLLVTAAD